MKTIRPLNSLSLFLALAVLAAGHANGGRFQRPANPRGALDPRGAYDPRGRYDPRGVADPRGVTDPRGVADPRGRYDPRNPARYMYTLPGAYARRVYAGTTYYLCGGTYYYCYYINGRPVYVQCAIVNGVPVIPPRPY